MTLTKVAVAEMTMATVEVAAEEEAAVAAEEVVVTMMKRALKARSQAMNWSQCRGLGARK
jgi:hypothetical protein